MPIKRLVCWGPLIPALILVAALNVACGSSSLLSAVSIAKGSISPNGDGINDSTAIRYTVTRNANISISFVGNDGKEYSFRKNERRAGGDYTATFSGAHTAESGNAKSLIIPDGDYRVRVVAQDDEGIIDEWSGTLVISGGDTTPLGVTDIVCNPCAFSPNGDGIDDESVISYELSKAATATIFATDAKGQAYALAAPEEKRAAPHSHRWNGTSGGRLLPDGVYALHILAQDKAGNVSEGTQKMTIVGGGTPRMEITEIRFEPSIVLVGGLLRVEMEVKNVGDTVLRTLGPYPGTDYTTQMNFNSFKGADDPNGPPLYFERAGHWRVGVSWSTADRPYPIRWGLGRDLLPGQEATITGTIRVLIDRTEEVFFWASVVQEGIGFPGGEVGRKKITISYQ